MDRQGHPCARPLACSRRQSRRCTQPWSGRSGHRIPLSRTCRPPGGANPVRALVTTRFKVTPGIQPEDRVRAIHTDNQTLKLTPAGNQAPAILCVSNRYSSPASKGFMATQPSPPWSTHRARVCRRVTEQVRREDGERRVACPEQVLLREVRASNLPSTTPRNSGSAHAAHRDCTHRGRSSEERAGRRERERTTKM